MPNVGKTKDLLAEGTKSLRARTEPRVTIDGDEFEVEVTLRRTTTATGNFGGALSPVLGFTMDSTRP